MDKIFLHGMKAETLIGVYEWERKQPQTLVIDLDIGLPPRRGSDDIADTVHYAEVCQAVRDSLRRQDFFLLETLAEHIAALVLSRRMGESAAGQTRHPARRARNRRGNRTRKGRLKTSRSATAAARRFPLFRRPLLLAYTQYADI